MPSILFYTLETELRAIVDHLDEDPEIAFVIENGARRWKAVDRMPRITPGHHALWHVPSGAPPLLDRAHDEDAAPRIADPFAGWEEKLPSANAQKPFFGSYPGIIWLHVSANAVSASPVVPMNAFDWIGDRYRSIGHGAVPSTRKWWRRLQTWIKSRSQIVPRGSLRASPPVPVDVAAFPAALAKLQSGASGEMNPPAP
jgi:hypothetical protein